MSTCSGTWWKTATCCTGTWIQKRTFSLTEGDIYKRRVYSFAYAPYTIISALGAGLESRLDNALTCHHRMIRPRSNSNSLGLLTLWQQDCLEGRLSMKAPRQSDSVGSAGVYLRVAESLSTCRVGERFDPWLNLRRLTHQKTGYSDRVGEDGGQSIPPEVWVGGFFPAVGGSGSKRCYEGTGPVLCLHLFGTTPEPALLQQASGLPSVWR